MTETTTTEVVEVDVREIEELLQRARSQAPLSEADRELICRLSQSYLHLNELVADKNTTIRSLRKALFGTTSEKTMDVLAGDAVTPPAHSANDPGSPAPADEHAPAKPKPKGHGRNSAADYQGAECTQVEHESLRPGQACPRCKKGKVYRLPDPAMLVRLTGRSPLRAQVWQLERLRCNLCGEVFKAKAPAGVGEEKYDPTTASMIALLRYGSGLPHNRIERLQGNLGIPLPASTQWEIVAKCAQTIEPAFTELQRLAAQGEVVHNDDTNMEVLAVRGQIRDRPADADDERTGIFTTGIVARVENKKIVLFFTGRQHAGENLADVLKQRHGESPPPILMCDGLSRNVPKDLEVILSNCLAHGRRKFVELFDSFPAQCRHVLEALREVYHHDATAKAQSLSPPERLLFHQTHSGPVMTELNQWLQEQLAERKVEPNSRLGDAIGYLLKRWQELTLFLRKPGAPLDNNLCEQALKRAIVHRKNSLFYKTENGAHVGDLFMSLIHTAELCAANPFDYLTQLQRHADALERNPSAWMPWNYAASSAATDPGK